MRETLTAFAILLILVLTAALAAPYFVDWNAQRGFLETRLSRALGQKVTIGGAIDLKLLPTPYLVLDQAVIGGDDGPITMGIRHLDLELSVAPLIHGEFEIVEARLEEPTVRITLQRDRTIPTVPDVPVLQADVRFDRISVSDGTVAIADPLSGRTFALEHLDIEAQVDSISGPFKGSGSVGSAALRTSFRFASSTGRFGRTHLKLLVDETPGHVGLELDGSLAFAGGLKDSLREVFDGRAAIFGHLQAGADILMPWRLSGPVHADPSRAALGDGALRLGSEEQAFLLAATGEASFGETSTARLSLASKQIDIDRLFGGGVSVTGEAKKPRLPSLADLRQAMSQAMPPLPIAIDVAAETATLGGEALGDVKGLFTLGGEGLAPVRFSGTGPGGSHIAVAGTLTPEPRAFDGLFDVSAGDLPAAATWVATLGPGFALPPDVGARSFAAKGHIALNEGAIDATGLALRLDRSVLTGSARYTPPQGDRPRLFAADLKADALDLDAMPDLAGLRTSRSADLDLRLEARAIKVVRFGDGPVNAGHIRFALAKRGGRIDLSAFRIEGLGGAAIDATGTLDPKGGAFEARLDADRLNDAAALARRLVPGALSDGFAARASALAPAKVAVSARLKPIDAGGFMPSAVTVKGTIGTTKLDATLGPDPAGADKIVASATMAAPEGSALLRQLGLPALPLDNLGVSQMVLNAHGVLGGALATTVHAAFGATIVDADGTLDIGMDAPHGSGSLKVASADVSPILQSAAIAFPDFLGHIAADLTSEMAWTPAGLSLSGLKGKFGETGVSGSLMWQAVSKATPALTGAIAIDKLSLGTLFSLPLGAAQPAASRSLWSSLPYGTGLVDPPAVRVALQVKAFDLGMGLSGQPATLELGISPGLFELNRLQAHAGGGDLGADLSIRREGPNATLQGKIVADKVRLGFPNAQGMMSGALDLVGGGRSAQALVASLAGAGSITVDALLIPNADPSALPKVFDDVEADRVSVDEDTIARALEEAGKAPLAAGSRTFVAGLASGVLRLDSKRDIAPSALSPVTSVISASLDITKPAIEEHVEQTLHALPKDWSGLPPQIVITFAGSLESPKRTTDVSAFLNALAARALARESARIEAYEYDIRERAFLNQRLQVDRAHEQERLKVEDDARLAAEAARKAEADRRAAELAAKQEKARREAQDKAAQARAAQDRASQEKALQDKILEDRQRPLPQAGETQPGANVLDQPAFQSPGNPADPTAAGRY